LLALVVRGSRRGEPAIGGPVGARRRIAPRETREKFTGSGREEGDRELAAVTVGGERRTPGAS
jgi:hypothetical protein